MQTGNKQKYVDPKDTWIMIPVAKPYLPPQEEYRTYLDSIWNRVHLTNNGPLVQKLESKLREYLGVKYLLYVSNGTIALQIAIKALDLKGEVITTPFSYVATTSSIVWEGCEPVFVDINPYTLNINPSLIENAITEKTSAILATHVFGNPCDIEAIQVIAKKHGLKVIYDAAHGFGTEYRGKSVFDYGDVITTSFHATKLFHTVEGGAVFTQDKQLFERMRYMRNFGHDGPGKFNGVGINGKNSEFHAAMGLCNLNYADSLLDTRKNQYAAYDILLDGSPVEKQRIQEGTTAYNCAYYPVIFESEIQALHVKKSLEDSNIFPRRYFYPSLNRLSYTKKFAVPCSDDISKRILCLPLYHSLKEDELYKVANIINECQKVVV